MIRRYTRRRLLGMGLAGGSAVTLAGALARRLDGERSSGPTGADRLGAWTPDDDAFLPSDRPVPYQVGFADLPVLGRAERRAEGQIRAIPHRWLRQIGRIAGLDPGAVDGYLLVSGRTLVQVVDWDHDPAAVADRLDEAGYDAVDRIGGFDVYRQPGPPTARQLRTLPRLDDAIAVDGQRLVTSGNPGIEDPVSPVRAAIEARTGRGRRVSDRPGVVRALLSDAPDADLLRVAPIRREWEVTDEPGLAGLRGYRRAVRFDDGVVHLRTKLLYEPSRQPDAETVRSLVVTDAVGPEIDPAAVEGFDVRREGDAAVATARAPLSAFTE